MGITDALIGIAVGDAFGSGIEFQDRNWIRANVDFTRFVNARTGKHAENYTSGDYSDDTEHSIGVVRALMDPWAFSAELLL
ncbi:MAG TPA: ADP-ribosylglycohydrolase family protein [Candidatus Nanoarchaeia archaeon]|nr:ADP-ribosylglycohydrolase family protein [Candidatus Nanoarchaeia archaeon]